MSDSAVALKSDPRTDSAQTVNRPASALNPNQRVTFATINIATFVLGLGLLAVLDPRDQRFLLTIMVAAAIFGVVNVMKWRIKATAADHLRYPAGKLADQ